MRKRSLIGANGLLISLLLVALQALPASAAAVRFGAKLSHTSQPTGAESCDQNAGIPHHATCTWVAESAFENGDNFKAPKDGTIGKVRLITCAPGVFTLQLARVKPLLHKAKVVRNGPIIHYDADPRQADGNPDTFCGGDNGDDYIIQAFAVNVHVNQGDYIAVLARKPGFIHNSGGGPQLLFSPPLSPGGSFQHADGDSSADLMLQLVYR
jgi:hypothetical protein